MKLIKTKPRYRCDFCKHSGIKSKMLVHEKICWRNPDRHCMFCNDKGWYMEDYGDEFPGVSIPCPYCSQFDPNKSPPLEPQKVIA